VCVCARGCVCGCGCGCCTKALGRGHPRPPKAGKHLCPCPPWCAHPPPQVAASIAAQHELDDVADTVLVGLTRLPIMQLAHLPNASTMSTGSGAALSGIAAGGGGGARGDVALGRDAKLLAVTRTVATITSRCVLCCVRVHVCVRAWVGSCVLGEALRVWCTRACVCVCCAPCACAPAGMCVSMCTCRGVASAPCMCACRHVCVCVSVRASRSLARAQLPACCLHTHEHTLIMRMCICSSSHHCDYLCQPAELQWRVTAHHCCYYCFYNFCSC